MRIIKLRLHNGGDGWAGASFDKLGEVMLKQDISDNEVQQIIVREQTMYRQGPKTIRDHRSFVDFLCHQRPEIFEPLIPRKRVQTVDLY